MGGAQSAGSTGTGDGGTRTGRGEEGAGNDFMISPFS